MLFQELIASASGKIRLSPPEVLTFDEYRHLRRLVVADVLILSQPHVAIFGKSTFACGRLPKQSVLPKRSKNIGFYGTTLC